jgi:hypothetical protein
MRKLILAAGFVASLGVSGLADTAAAQPPYYHHYQHRHYARCRYERHRSGAIGAVAGAGALTGHALARSTVHC